MATEGRQRLETLTAVALVWAVAAVEDAVASIVGIDALVTTGALELVHCAVVDWKIQQSMLNLMFLFFSAVVYERWDHVLRNIEHEISGLQNAHWIRTQLNREIT